MGLFSKKSKVDEIRRELETRTRRVLLVDDDQLFLTQLTELLGKQGLEVVGLRSATDALGRSDLGRFDLAISDVVMPEMDGLEFFERLRRLPAGSAMKLVLMTAADPTPLRAQAERLGCVGFLTKPIDERITIETLRALLH